MPDARHADNYGILRLARRLGGAHGAHRRHDEYLFARLPSVRRQPGGQNQQAPPFHSGHVDDGGGLPRLYARAHPQRRNGRARRTRRRFRLLLRLHGDVDVESAAPRQNRLRHGAVRRDERARNGPGPCARHLRVPALRIPRRFRRSDAPVPYRLLHYYAYQKRRNAGAESSIRRKARELQLHPCEGRPRRAHHHALRRSVLRHAVFHRRLYGS